MDVHAGLAQVVGALAGGGEARPGQRRMAAAVAGALDAGRHVAVQAGTGTGKSLAYLVPAVLSGKRVVVATATKALQDQLAGQDLPLLEAGLGRPFRWAVLKGRSNYVCLQRVRELRAGGAQGELGVEGAGRAAEVAALLGWADRTTSGDRAELEAEPSPAAWAAVSVGSEECPGAARCPSGEACFAEAARRRAAEAHVLVVNTHLYGVHLAAGGTVLPEHDAVVVDEAHALEEVVSATAGVELTAGRWAALARAVGSVVADDALVALLAEAGDAVALAAVPLVGSRLRGGNRGPLDEALGLARERVERAGEALRALDVKGHEDATARKVRAQLAATSLLSGIDAVLRPRDGHVGWVEGRADRPVVRVAPVDVAEVLAEGLFGASTVVLTSATLPVGLAARLGVESADIDELDVGSPFDHEGAALLYCAAHLPPPGSPAHEAAAHEELRALIDAAGGRTLALFTSWRAMHAAAEALRPRIEWPLLTQADKPKPALLEAFREDERSCLFATLGFWQGVDVPGPALQLVVIDRIPFPRPDEPLTQARRERAGPGAFAAVDLPRAATLLAQGAGRLLRSASDRGVVAVLDPRLASASYRWTLVGALPPMRRTRHRADAEAWLRQLDADASARSGRGAG